VKRLARLTVAVALVAVAGPALAGEVKVSFSSGRVTIVAIDASPRQILAEWARQGQVRITNLDRLSGGPINLQMTNVPEAQALETLLRGTAGYVAAPRVEGVVAASSYDRIMLMPGVAPPLPAARASSQPAMNTGGGRGRQADVPARDAMADEDAEVIRQLLESGRNAARTDPYRQSGQGQVVMPGIMAPSYGQYAGEPGSRASMTQTEPAAGAARQPATAGATMPGVFTAPPEPLAQPTRAKPSSADLPPQAEAPAAISSPVPGQVVGQRPQAVGAPAATTIQSPYGLPGSVRPPVVNPSANPYGVTTPVKPPPATPPAPIKKSGTSDGA